MDVVYLVRNEYQGINGGEVIFTTTDGNKALEKSIELIKDCYGHEVEVWIDGKKCGKVDVVL